MARPQKNDLAARGLARALTKLARKDPTHGRPKDIEFWVRSTYGKHVSDVTLAKAFKGELDPSACNLEVLRTLQGYYKIEDYDVLGPYAAERLRTEDAMVLGKPTPPIAGGSVTGESESACTRLAPVIALRRTPLDVDTTTERTVAAVGG